MPIAVIIPCYRVRNHISDVVNGLVDLVDAIYIVDDCCPENTGEFVEGTFKHDKIIVLRHKENLGVGGALVTGYRAAARDGHKILVKMDGDDQMDPAYLKALVAPIFAGQADYTKGNRFYSLRHLDQMPKTRLLGNAVLSLVNKISSGYWNLMDPTNGYTAIHSSILGLLPLEKLSQRYFFESDMLFRLGTIRAVVKDVPIPSRYGDEKSSLNIFKVSMTFPMMYGSRFIKRILYTYFIRDLSVGSMELVLGLALFFAGTALGVYEWTSSAAAHMPATSGTVMLAALPIMLGFQLLLSAVIFDVNNVPTSPLHPQLPDNYGADFG